MKYVWIFYIQYIETQKLRDIHTPFFDYTEIYVQLCHRHMNNLKYRK